MGLTTEELIAEYGELISLPLAAKITTSSVRTLKRLIDRGELALYRVGSTRTYRVRTADLAALIVQVA